MRNFGVIGAAFLAGIILASAFFLLIPSAQRAFCVNSSAITPVFSPNSDGQLLSFIASAKQTLDVELYQFSYPPLLSALQDAAARGVAVRLILEPRIDANLETGAYLAAHGVSVRWASLSYANTHSKSAVADGKRVLVGSINWSRHALTLNREAAVIIDDENVAGSFERIFESDWAAGTEAVPA
ncbi:Cardiolipin synthase B [Candidatus Norongarragalina meridionalis]|nr:Cardiolipin synthase B [Candidatus Norongarragalina meridionalis]